MVRAGFWRRTAAYILDIAPLLLLTGTVFYLFLGFGETWAAYNAEPRNLEKRIQFLVERNRIRDSTFVLWLIYSVIMEASPLQGTLGKVALGLRVVGPDGGRLTMARSIGRNLAKILSYLPIGLGFLWVAFSREKRAWHDMLARTAVIHGRSEAGGISRMTVEQPSDSKRAEGGQHLPPRPNWRPDISVDTDRTASTADYHLGGKFSFAVLEHGTCVALSPEELTDPQGAVESIMRKVLYSHPDVKTRSKDDGNWLILYSHPAVATVVFGDVVEANWAYIEKNHLDGMVEGEVLRDSSGQIAPLTRDVKIALFGRAYMFMDALSPKVVKVWRRAETK